ncbi:type II toxin-antitoxin system PemK/MazF family toxin [Hydrogenimonas thermophila]|uniref:mRNA-degrading endonuclease, toxin component of the MazEF toxin-antitoxin module n=1 Tax=Hydrogenimonas thermophila TaxID=223786 RepID=A0A1I5UWZ4_9BACT|nr:type II toxin-antitoxin system PemK/MazF family toxin [Hydrogenimonas thermophila]SFP99738.1 mRNA-degrading endonuclease, toxin component of the MazEF toxin-antitoxin module [Hydrogenimonas thermophila]
MNSIHQWQVILLHFGEYLDKFDTESSYCKDDLKNGVNIGREFSEPHMAIVLSPNALCKGDTVLVVPITEYTNGDERHWDKVVLRKSKHSFLHKDSSVHLSAIRNISKKRIIKSILSHINKDVKKEIKDKICSMLRI